MCNLGPSIPSPWCAASGSKFPKIQNETPILSCILWNFFKALYSTQLFKIWTLSYRDNVTGHTLVTLGKGRRVPELCHWGPGVLVFCSCFCSHVSHVVLAFWGKKHMGFLLWQAKKCWLTDFRRKRQVSHRAFQNLTEGYMLISTKSVYLSYNA